MSLAGAVMGAESVHDRLAAFGVVGPTQNIGDVWLDDSRGRVTER